VSICLEVVVGGGFGGTITYHAGGWGECGGCSNNDKEAFGLKKGGRENGDI